MACPDVPSFATDILPNFTEIDIDHMKPHDVYLDQYDWMKVPTNASNVYAQLAEQNMPPGGPYWTADQLTCLQNWMNTGYQP